LRPYFVQNKYVLHTNNTRPSPEDQQRPPEGAPHILGTSALYSPLNIVTLAKIMTVTRDALGKMRKL